VSGIPWIHDTALGANLSLWDEMNLGGILWPGVWAIEPDKKRALDVIKVRKQDGALIRDDGYAGVTFKASGRIWTADQWSLMQEILPDFDPQQQGGTRSPLALYCPAAAFFSVNQVYIERIGLRKPGGGIIPIEMDLLQWFSAPKATVQQLKGVAKAGAPLNPAAFTVPPSKDTGSKI